MKDYTFYIATNPALSAIYGNQGVPVKIGYASGCNWGARVHGLNGKLDAHATRYGEVKDFEYLLDENWRIPCGCLLYIRTADNPEHIEKKIAKEVLAEGGKQIDGHYTLKSRKAIRSTELYILPEKTKHIRVRSASPSWDAKKSFYAGGSPSQSSNVESEEVKVPVDDLLRYILIKIAEVYNQ